MKKEIDPIKRLKRTVLYLRILGILSLFGMLACYAIIQVGKIDIVYIQEGPSFKLSDEEILKNSILMVMHSVVALVSFIVAYMRSHMAKKAEEGKTLSFKTYTVSAVVLYAVYLVRVIMAFTHHSSNGVTHAALLVLFVVYDIWTLKKMK